MEEAMEDKASQQTRVWLVEDNSSFRTSVQRVVNQLDGLVCDGSFESVEAAFEALETTAAPTVMLLDVQLPGMDGISALGKLKELAPETHILILTVFDDADKIFRAVCAGAAGYILKTAGMDEIGEAIQQVVDGGAPMTPKVAKKVLSVFSKVELNHDVKPDYNLTGREQDILRLMADGLIKKEIAERLEISVHTVSTHLRSVYEKLHVNTNTGAVAKALREGII
ncbi:MAG: response regulator transcription factor [Akkermansiaceae bacterium]|nr:response regulator transcription factor [Akkermansiaceae bacterium]NNM30248.1 response regulator transcription factor [Akkermansiaceae bacterium]